MKRLIWFLILALAPCAWAQTGTVTAVAIEGATGCSTAPACNGWVADITMTGIGTGGTYAFGLGANNTPATAKIIFTVTSKILGTSATGTRLVYGVPGVNTNGSTVMGLRKAYPNQNTNDETANSGNAIVRVALSEFIYAGDTVTAVIGAGFYTDTVPHANLAYSGAVTNNSTQAYSAMPPVGRWATVAYQRVTGPFTIEAAVFHRFAQQGRPVYSVVFSCTDGTNTTTSTATVPTISSAKAQYGDVNPVIVYAGNFNASSFIEGDTLTCNFSAYPWIGDSTAVLTSSGGTAGSEQPLAPLLLLDDKNSTYGTGCAVIDPTNGATWSSGHALVYDSCALAEAGYTTSTANSYKSVGMAAEACKAYNAAVPATTHNDPGGCTAELSGLTTYPGTAAGSTLGAQATWFNITKLSTVSTASAGFSAGTLTTINAQRVHFQNITISGSSTYIVDNTGNGIVWADGLAINNTTATTFYAWNLGYATGNAITTMSNGFLKYGSYKMPFILMRGNSFSSSSHNTGISAPMYCILGNANITPVWQGTGNAWGEGISDGSVFAFNTNYNIYNTGAISAGVSSFSDSAALVAGVALVQNVAEETATSATAPVWEIFDQNAGNAPNVLMQFNTLAGGRIDQRYNYQQTGTGPIYFFNVSDIGNLYDNYNYNGDTSGPAQANNYGNLSVDYSVGQKFNVKRSTNGANLNNWCGVFIGLYGQSQAGCNGSSTTVKIPYISDASYNIGNGGSNAGNGNYRLKSGSAAGNIVAPGGNCVLPYDLDGQVRNCSGYGSAGAYEQARLLTGVTAF